MKDALELIKSTGKYSSPQFVEFLDRIIGSNMYDIPAQEVVPVLKAFIESGKAREKII